MDPKVFWKSPIMYDLVPVYVTNAVSGAVDEPTIMDMIDKANQARENRGITIKKDQMYYIRMAVPPNPRLVTVMFVWMNEGVIGYVAYYDEIEHILKDAGPDLKKLPGSPFDNMAG